MPDEIGRDDAGRRPRDDQQAGKPQTGTEPELRNGGDEGRHPDDPGTHRERPQRRGPKPAVAQQLRLDQRLGHPGLHDDERQQHDRGGCRQDPGADIDTVTHLGECGDEQGNARRQQEQAGQVDSAPVGRQRFGDAAHAGPQQQHGRHTDGHIAFPPMCPEGRRQQRAGGDAGPDAGSPHRRRVDTRLAGRVVVRQYGQPARKHRSPAHPFQDTGRDEQHRFTRDPAERGPDPERAQAEREHPAPAVVVAEHSDGQQRRGEPDRHRTQHPRAGRGGGPEFGRGARQRGHRRDVGDQHQRGGQCDRCQRPGRNASGFDFQTHSWHSST